MATEMIINNEGDYSFVDSTGYIDYISFEQAINILAEWIEKGKIINHTSPYDHIDQWWII